MCLQSSGNELVRRRMRPLHRTVSLLSEYRRSSVRRMCAAALQSGQWKRYFTRIVSSRPNQWLFIGTNSGCTACACDPLGVVEVDGQPQLECNNIDGQCHCKPGRGGRTCSECQDLYWGDPLRGECKRCECNSYGSKTLQCHRDNGTCICNEGSGGPLCNECARG